MVTDREDGGAIDRSGREAGLAAVAAAIVTRKTMMNRFLVIQFLKATFFCI